MTRKEKKALARILLAGVLLVAVSVWKPEGYLALAAYLVPYAIVGWDVLWKAVRNIAHGQVFDENFLMALATVGALVLGNLALLFFGERLLIAAGYGIWPALLRCRVIVFFLAVTGLNALLFKTVPRRELTFRDQLPWAAFSAATWLAFSQIYSWAVERFRFFSVYGGLAIVIISLFWMYCSLYLLFMGAWLNTLRDKKR